MSLILTTFISCLCVHLNAETDSIPFWINEWSQSTSSGDNGNFIEVAGPAGTKLADYSLIFYNEKGKVIRTLHFDENESIIPDQDNGYGTLSITLSDLPLTSNPRGIAVFDELSSTVLEFISFFGSITGIEGPAIDMDSVDIFIQHLYPNNAQNNQSGKYQTIQLCGNSGLNVEHLKYIAHQINHDSNGKINACQTFQAAASKPKSRKGTGSRRRLLTSPSTSPTETPTDNTGAPTRFPTADPTVFSTTQTPTTEAPTQDTGAPTRFPTADPTVFSTTQTPTTEAPTQDTGAPTRFPTADPTVFSTTMTPTTEAPTQDTGAPTRFPTADPTVFSTTQTPTTEAPTQDTGAPTRFPTADPTVFSTTQTPTTEAPTQDTNAPSLAPSVTPTTATPTTETESPTVSPTEAPTDNTGAPTRFPTADPTIFSTTQTPTTEAPTATPTADTSAPSVTPSMSPTTPTLAPSQAGSATPTSSPTMEPTEASQRTVRIVDDEEPVEIDGADGCDQMSMLYAVMMCVMVILFV